MGIKDSFKTKMNDLDLEPIPEPVNVYRTKNHIYFISEVNDESVSKLKTCLKELYEDYKLIEKTYNCEVKPTTYLHITTSGGSIFSGMLAKDIIEDFPYPIETIIEGYCASAGTLMSLSGSVRKMTKTSFILIHQLSSYAFGKFSELKDDLENNSKFMDIIKEFYLTKTKLTEAILDDLLKRDLWLSSKEAIEYGLIDSVETIF